ncbi:MAG: CRISPR system precrRNA processing endoribonuclease RAMP protein Cas6 [Bryobacteraceae bacterium]|nr:CRISPR system precrRNA processing endoribonuclease RAMP protein Cas6 [Bryobacteraceae bacterium]
MFFELYAWRWTFVALEPIRFDHAGNTLRGALGLALRDDPDYGRWFRPNAAKSGPSGFADPPRPFVLRAMHLDGQTIPASESFSFDIHSFETRVNRYALLHRAIEELGRQGLGRGRGRAVLQATFLDSHTLIRLPLTPDPKPVHQIRVCFLSPTELKGTDPSSFRTLFARSRDRVSTISSLYGSGAYDIDFRALGERAAAIRTTRFDVNPVEARRKSTRTGETHTLGGFVGEAIYEGELSEFVPWLEAAQWSGVGRQTVWGNGAFTIFREK